MSYLWSCSFQHAQPHSSVCARVFMYHLYGQTAEYLVPIHTLVSGLCCTCTRVVCTGDERDMIYSEGSRVIHFSKVPQSPRKLPFSTSLWPVLYLSWFCYSKNMLPLLFDTFAGFETMSNNIIANERVVFQFHCRRQSDLSFF